MTSADLKANDSDTKYNDADQVEQREYYVEPVGSRTKLKRHCARRWWIHVIVFCICFLIIALCLVYAAMPKIAQDGVNRSHLEFTSLGFFDPSAEELTLAQNSTLHSPSMYTPTLDSFTAALYLVTNGTYSTVPMSYIPMPQIHALHPTSEYSLTRIIPVSDLDVLTEYATQVISQKNVTTALTGRTRLHEGKLPAIWVNYNSSSTYTALNGLQGFNVTGTRVNISAKTGEQNLKGYAYVPNPSIMTVALGNVTLELSTEQAGVVGTTTINDMTLVPGNNTLPMFGTVNQTALLASTNSSGYVTLSIIGQSSIYNGVHLTYYERALSSNTLKLDLNVKQVIADSLAATS